MINPKDVLEAVAQLEFGAFLPRLEAELASNIYPRPTEWAIDLLTTDG
jgi:hypothetical protein